MKDQSNTQLKNTTKVRKRIAVSTYTLGDRLSTDKESQPLTLMVGCKTTKGTPNEVLYGKISLIKESKRTRVNGVVSPSSLGLNNEVVSQQLQCSSSRPHAKITKEMENKHEDRMNLGSYNLDYKLEELMESKTLRKEEDSNTFLNKAPILLYNI